jgi:Lipid A core - O-antigen ligase and related enzymes
MRWGYDNTQLTYKYILLIFVFFLCSGTLFLTSFYFVETHTTPKNYSAIFGILLFYIFHIFYFLLSKKNVLFPNIRDDFFLIITILCTSQALYGIFQYIGIFQSTGGWRVTGSFDNPAGFAASLCAGFPFLFYFVFNKRLWMKCLALLAIMITALAVGLSVSRTGIISLAVVLTTVIFFKLTINKKLKIALVIVLLTAVSGLYFLKKDSANGRLLIWRCSLEMIKDKPFSGHGYGGFKANYMNYQAQYFEEHPNSNSAMLAANVNRPFNEYLLLLTNYGCLGFILFLVFIGFIWKSFRKCNNDDIANMALWCLFAIGVFAFFSYPLTYPFVWIMGLISIYIILCKGGFILVNDTFIHWGRKSYFFVVILVVMLAICILTYNRMSAEIKWNKIARQSLFGNTIQMLHVYRSIYDHLKNNELFLYNYAAELNVAEQYNESLHIAQECELLLADYDLQMLMANNYQSIHKYTEAERLYQKAMAMCPVKFMPLYKLFQLYEITNEKEKAVQVANVIMNKPVKIMSPIIINIRREIEQKINCN